jgi:outer membrane protein assembly factor BamB
VTPHDIRDYDFEATPVLATRDGVDLVFGAGKAGRVIAWNRSTHRRVWTAVVGVHRNDVGPLPQRRVSVCPGLLGGVETPMAYAGGKLFVPVVDLCVQGSAVGYQDLTEVDASKGRGRLVALDADTGSPLWERVFPSPDFGCASVSNDVVLTSTYDGTVYALDSQDGRILWKTRMRAGVNACPAVAGDMLLVGAGAPRPRAGRSVFELVAFGL